MANKALSGATQAGLDRQRGVKGVGGYGFNARGKIDGVQKVLYCHVIS